MYFKVLVCITSITFNFNFEKWKIENHWYEEHKDSSVCVSWSQSGYFTGNYDATGESPTRGQTTPSKCSTRGPMYQYESQLYMSLPSCQYKAYIVY